MLVRGPGDVKEATTDSPCPDVAAIPHEFIFKWRQVASAEIGPVSG